MSTVSSDHIFPHSLKGTNAQENLVASCRKCNEAKGSMTVYEYYQTLHSDEYERFKDRVMLMKQKLIMPDDKAALLLSDMTIDVPVQPPFTLSDKQVHKLMSETNRCCIYCGRLLNQRTICEDYIVPLSKGGKASPKNMTICCVFCHQSKAGRSAKEYSARFSNSKLSGYKQRIKLQVSRGFLQESKALTMVRDAPFFPQRVWTIKVGRLTVSFGWKRRRR